MMLSIKKRYLSAAFLFCVRNDTGRCALGQIRKENLDRGSEKGHRSSGQFDVAYNQVNFRLIPPNVSSDSPMSSMVPGNDLSVYR